MNSLLRIRIQVAVQQAKEIAKLQGQIKQVVQAANAAGAAKTGGLGSGFTEATKSAKVLQSQIQKINQELGKLGKTTAVKDPFSKINASLANFGGSSNLRAGQANQAAEAKAATQAWVRERGITAAKLRSIDASVAAYGRSESIKAAQQAAGEVEKIKSVSAAKLMKVNQNLSNWGVAEEKRAAAAAGAAWVRERGVTAAKLRSINQSVAAFGSQTSLREAQGRTAAVAKQAQQEINLRRRAAQEAADAELAAKGLSARGIQQINQNLANWGTQASIAMHNRQVAADKAANEKMVSQARQRIQQIMKLQAVGAVSTGSARQAITGIGVKVQDVRVANDVAVALGRLQKAEDRAAASAQRLAEAAARNRKSLMDMGRQVQWTGRQLEYNFTLPLVAAGRQIFELQVDTNKAMTSIVKVYGDGTDAADKLVTKYMELGTAMASVNQGAMTEAETQSYELGQAIRLLSDHFGDSTAEVSEMAGMWAAAGLKGAALLKAVRLTQEAMLIGDFSSSKEAFQGLIQIQGAYGLSLDELRLKMGELNAVENATAIGFADLVDVIARSGSVGASAGVTMEQLAGMAASIVPFSGTAENAGNALKTLFSRILVPSPQAAELLDLVGLNIESIGWNSMSATDRLIALGGAMENLSDAQKAQVASYVAGRYQINRFDVLVKALTDTESNYYKVLELTKDGMLENGQAATTYRKEVEDMLQSSGKTIEIMKTRIMNAGSQILIQLMPAIEWIVQSISDLATRFADLDPGIQKMIIIGLVVLAAVGPIMRLVGAFMQLVGVFQIVGKAILGLRAAMVALSSAALANPWVLLGIAIIAAGAAIWYFRDEILGGLQAVWDYVKPWIQGLGKGLQAVFNALPASVKNALMAVLRIVIGAAKAIWTALQAINPFARHSPSLVDNVIAGVDLIAKKYASLSNIGNVFRQATADMAAFGAATAGLMAGQKESERNKIRETVGGAAPGALPALEGMFSSQDALEGAIKAVSVEMDAQKAVVATLEKEYDQLGLSLDIANAALDEQREHAAALKEQMDAAQAEVDRYARAQIQGMGAADDAAFENEMAIKRVKLAIMDLEDAGGSIEDIQQRMADLAGEIETMQGVEKNLRDMGAGSEITGPIRERITALQAEARTVKDQVAPYNDLQEQLEALERQGERMDLENSLKFDPLTRQIDKMTEAIEELPFDVIVKGITDNKKRVEDLGAAYDVATRQVEAQEAVVKDLESARTALNVQIDAEKAKLDELQAAYDGLKDQLDAVNSMLDSIVSAAEAATDALDGAGSALEEAWDAAEGAGDFAIEPSLEGIDEGTIAQWIEDFKKEFAGFAMPNPFDKIKEFWQKFKDWWNNTVPAEVQTVFGGLGALIVLAIFGPFTLLGVALIGAVVGILAVIWYFRDEIWAALKWVWDRIVEGFNWGKDQVQKAWEALTGWSGWDWMTERFSGMWESIKDFADMFVDKIKELWSDLKPRFAKFKELGEPLARLWELIMDGLEPVIKLFGWLGQYVDDVIKVLVAVVTIAFGVLWEAIRVFVDLVTIAWSFLWDLVIAVVGPAIDIIFNIIKFFIATLTGDWGAMKDALVDTAKALWEMLKGIFWAIVNNVWDLLKWLWGEIDGFVKAVLGFFKDLGVGIYDKFIKPLGGWIADVVQWFLDLPGKLLNALGDLGMTIWDGIKEGFRIAKENVSGWVSDIIGFFTGLPGKISEAATSLYDAVLGFAGKIPGAIMDGLGAAWGFAGNLVDTIGNGLRSVVNGLLTTIEDGINGAIDKINEAMGKLPLVGGSIPDIPHIPSLPRVGHVGDTGPAQKVRVMHQGGLVPGTPGSNVPAILQAGEFVLSRRMLNELKPLAAGSGQTKTTVFNGDLSFPNVKTGDDAERFLRNLEALAVN